MGEVVSLQKGGFDVTREENELAIAHRVRQARESSGLTQQDMADTLHCGYEAYRKYETRSAFPIGLVADFCRIARVDMEWLLTGKVHSNRTTPKTGKSSVTEFKPRQIGAVQ